MGKSQPEIQCDGICVRSQVPKCAVFVRMCVCVCVCVCVCERGEGDLILFLYVRMI